MKNDLTGMTFGRLTVVDLDGVDLKGHYSWLCLCECGNVTRVFSYNLTRGSTMSCGCLRAELASAQRRARGTPMIPGARYGRLTVVGAAGRNASGKALVQAVCDCGAVRVARWADVLGGRTQSCGCLRERSVMASVLARRARRAQAVPPGGRARA